MILIMMAAPVAAIEQVAVEAKAAVQAEDVAIEAAVVAPAATTTTVAMMEAIVIAAASQPGVMNHAVIRIGEDQQPREVEEDSDQPITHSARTPLTTQHHTRQEWATVAVHRSNTTTKSLVATSKSMRHQVAAAAEANVTTTTFQSTDFCK